MKNKSPFSDLSLAVLFMALMVSTSLGQSQLPVTDNAKPPYLCVYRWGISGLEKGLYTEYPGWLNRTTTWAEDFQPTEDWDNIRGAIWQTGQWAKWVREKPGRRLVLSVPLLPGAWDRSGPKRGIDTGVPVSLEEGSKGAYNKHFQALGEELVKRGLENTVLRLGWEFNGGWYVYRAANREKFFAEYWRQIVTTMRAVPGQKFVFNWNPAGGWNQFPATQAWPGDEYVDEVGVDIYDQSWAPDTYPIPEGADDQEAQRRREKAWSDWINNKEKFGLAFWADFAKKHNKPLTIPEWGICYRKDGHGGGDNVYFIEQMHAFITNPDNNVTWHCYFDVNAGDGHHQLVPDGKNPETAFPKAAATFKKLFGLPNPAK
jgi:hypothetical protein